MNPIQVAREVEDRYRRYLTTMFNFRDPEFSVLFARALETERLAKGPYIDATPVFNLGSTTQALFSELLGQSPERAVNYALDGERRLYRHQEEAIRKIHAGRNVVVATGTGSGKTEAFLYPILLELMRQHRADALGPGVRAMTLYPMNALANDQRERLGAAPRNPLESGGIAYKLADAEAGFRFTYGQYTGQTPEDSPRRGQIAQEGELVTRAQMRETPPHILLTNYSMLEYLLLRPDDSPLFDGEWARTWMFFVLDEAHQYRGSRGAEMSMLIRRLKQRLRDAGNTNRFRCIATSASLTGDDKSAAAVAEFAAALFGEPFEAEDIIAGEVQELSDGGMFELAPEDYSEMKALLENPERKLSQSLSAIARSLGIDWSSVTQLPNKLGAILGADKRARGLKLRISGQPQLVSDVAKERFPELGSGKQVDALDTLVTLMAQCRDSSGAPLLTGRYHLMLKALEGAFVSYHPIKTLTLDHRTGPGSFEIALCRECGQHYFVGKIVGSKLGEAIRDPGDVAYGADYFRLLDRGIEEDEEPEDPDPKLSRRSGSQVGGEYELCLRCGSIGIPHSGCSCPAAYRKAVIKEDSATDRRDQIQRCGACGYNAAGRDPVRELTYGNDGPHAVIAQALVLALSEPERKILAFADGRQEAAFFAWYFQESYADILRRNHLLLAAQRVTPEKRQSISLHELAHALSDVYESESVLPDSTTAAARLDRAYEDVYRELLTNERRISLEGTGAGFWHIQLPKQLVIPKILLAAPWSLSNKESQALIQTLLDSMRQEQSMELKGARDRPISADRVGLPQMAHALAVTHGKREATHRIAAWDGERARRVGYLRRVLLRRNNTLDEIEAQRLALQAVRSIWETIAEYDRGVRSKEDRILVELNDSRRLNPSWWRFQRVENDDEIFQCNTCRRLSYRCVAEACPTPRCKGALVPISRSALPKNIYFQSYTEKMPGHIVSEEHTAQLSDDLARRFQQQFKEGSINLLSCSTTFELGVDLGDLNTVFLRNVPPEAFNYSQRVGRAGRRAGAFGLAITYCRRNSHDLYHYRDPYWIIRGKTKPPTLSIQNAEVVLRHITAWALSDFFRNHPDRFGRVKDFFGDLRNPSAQQSVRMHLVTERQRLETALRALVPQELWGATGINNHAWVDRCADASSRLGLAQAEISEDMISVQNLESNAANRKDYSTAKWAAARARTLESEATLTFLSRKVVIPKYGFPVDVVDLDTSLLKTAESKGVQLQRDLSIAISEFAPSSELIANKLVWRSHGLKHVRDREWPVHYYRRCRLHNTFVMRQEGGADAGLPCGCDEHEHTFLVPIFGFTVNRFDDAKPPTRKAERMPSSRPYYAGHIGETPVPVILKDQSGFPLLEVFAASPGRMIALCEGRQGKKFYICPSCGYGSANYERKPHRTAYGNECAGTLKCVALGYEFATDVLQFSPLRFNPAERLWGTLSLAYALAEGAAEALEVPSTDLNATALVQGHSSGSIILYDNVPGGAGLVAQLTPDKALYPALQAALKKVDGGCGCEPDTSCYSCLRNYSNQFAHTHLKRGVAKDYLETLLSRLNSEDADR